MWWRKRRRRRRNNYQLTRESADAAGRRDLRPHLTRHSRWTGLHWAATSILSLLTLRVVSSTHIRYGIGHQLIETTGKEFDIRHRATRREPQSSRTISIAPQADILPAPL